jgi:hypothetical protein
MRAVLFAMALAACSDTTVPADATTPTPDADDSCAELELATEAVPDIGEVMVGGRLMTSGTWYVCTDVAAAAPVTWTTFARRRRDNQRLGSFGTIEQGSTHCIWSNALAQRTPATGACKPEGV